MTMTWPNKSPEPTAVGAYLLREGFRRATSQFRRGSAFFVRPHETRNLQKHYSRDKQIENGGRDSRLADELQSYRRDRRVARFVEIIFAERCRVAGRSLRRALGLHADQHRFEWKYLF